MKEYEELLEGIRGDDDELQLNNVGKPVIREAQTKKSIFNSTKKEDVKAKEDLRKNLVLNYGKEIADKAFLASDLDSFWNKSKPLTIGGLKKALGTAATLHADELYKKQYEEREKAAWEWKPDTKPSELTEEQFRGLRLHKLSSTQSESEKETGPTTEVHAWHMRNHSPQQSKEKYDINDWYELDTAVKAEMERLPHLDKNPRAQNLQARLNLLETMVSRAEKSATTGATQVFVAPEWLFTGMEGLDQGKNKVSGGALTETEMRKLTTELTKLSERHPKMTIMPGTILWSKPVKQPLEIEGRLAPCDMVFNTAPVLENGKLNHMAYKTTEGLDTHVASAGLETPSPYKLPDRDNEHTARIQLFMSDNNLPTKFSSAVGPTQDLMKKMSAPGSEYRNWENELRSRQKASPHNHLFESQGKTFAMEICGDHGDAPALNEMTKSKMHQGTEGVDVHLVVANGVTINNSSCCIKPGGIYASIDMQTGDLTSRPVIGYDKRENVRSLGKTAKIGLMGTDEKPLNVSQKTNIPKNRDLTNSPRKERSNSITNPT